MAIRDGRTSSEIVRKRSYAQELDEMGNIVGAAEAEGEETHEELVVLDRSGRLQLSKDHMEKLGVKGGDKLKAEFDEETGRVVLFRSDG